MHSKLVVIPHRISGTLWLSEHVGIQESAERHQLETYWDAPNDDTSLDEQVELATRAIHQKAYALVVSPNANSGLNRQILEAVDHGIPVVLAGESAGVDRRPGVSFVLSDLNQTGKLVADRLGQLLDHHGDVLIVGLDPHAPGNVERSDAIATTLAQSEPRITIADKLLGTGSSAHSKMLLYHSVIDRPNLRAIVALNADEAMAAASAVRTAGKLGQIKIIACDQSQALFVLLDMGAVDSFVVQDNRQQGNLAVDFAVQMHADPKASFVRFVEPQLVTQSNIHTEPIQQLLLMHR